MNLIQEYLPQMALQLETFQHRWNGYLFIYEEGKYCLIKSLALLQQKGYFP